jgi:hypothetical protein
MNARSIRDLSWLGWLIGGVAALLMLALALKLGPMENRPASAACQGNFTINFGGLAHGAVVHDQYSAQGVQVSVQANEGFPDAIIVFDTNRPATHDPDLAVNIGNIAILAKNLTDSNSDGLVDDPDENNFGGKVTFTFDQDVNIGSFVFVDHDHQPADFAAAYDASGSLIKKVFIPIAGNGSVQTVNVGADGVRRFELVYRDSGGFTGIEVMCPSAATPTGTPAGGGATATPAGATATPVAGGGQSTPTPRPTAAAATPTPAVQAVSATSTPAATAPSAVAAAVSRPSAAQGLPVTGGPPSDGGLASTASVLTLAGILAALTGGILLLHAQGLSPIQAAASSFARVHRPKTAHAFQRPSISSKASGRTWGAVVELYAAKLMARLTALGERN